jgi:hypothetical protein
LNAAAARGVHPAAVRTRRRKEWGMGATQAIRFEGITAPVWQRLRAQAGRVGARIPEGPAGSVAALGVTLRYAWNAVTATLTVWLLRLPLWFGAGIVEARLREAVRDCGGR